MVSILLNLIYKFNITLIKIQEGLFLVAIKKLIGKYIQKNKGNRLVKTILEKKNKVGELIPPNFKSFCKSTVTKTV